MQAVFENIWLELDNIKLIMDWWDVLILYKLNNASEYNHLIIKYCNFHHSQYTNIPQYCQKFIILIVKFKNINSKPTLKNQNITFLFNVYL